VISPLLANIYLHYVIDQWAECWRRHEAAGGMIIVRYADDIIVGFEHETDARRLLDAMCERLKKFTNDGDLAHVWALEGAGLLVKSIWDVRDDVDAGRLEVVLPQLRLPASPIHAVYPHSRLAAAKVHLCVNFLAAKMKFAGRIGPRQDQYTILILGFLSKIRPRNCPNRSYVRCITDSGHAPGVGD
jgi:Reverse transcriptase (RNA-dependent DNA polymerase)/LysR substrate binding domain